MSHDGWLCTQISANYSDVILNIQILLAAEAMARTNVAMIIKHHAVFAVQ